MNKEEIDYFNQLYDETYMTSLKYVVSKCGQCCDISDILQEIYLEIYQVILKRGIGYIENQQAFVLRVAKSKIYKHYSLKQKLKNIVPLFNLNSSGEEYNIIELEGISELNTVEQNMINTQLIQQMWNYLQQKSETTMKIFYLYYYCNCTLQEIAIDLGLSESVVKNRLYRTLKEIRLDFLEMRD